jgi:hypothetical protein
MGDSTTYAVRVDKDSEMYEAFEEYKESEGFHNTSEALRQLIRGEIFDETPDGDTESAEATRSTLTAVGLYTVAQLVAFPVAARYTLLLGAAVFAGAGVVGYGRVLLEMIGERIELDDPDDLDDDGGAVAHISPLVRLVGGAMVLLSLLFTAVSGGM